MVSRGATPELPPSLSGFSLEHGCHCKQDSVCVCVCVHVCEHSAVSVCVCVCVHVCEHSAVRLSVQVVEKGRL